jgi:NAD(P)-dependent dehydrogenase (short-subunit alcohol dehydrogenase family)
MRILIIGASGTIGKPVSELLGGRHEVIGATRSHPKFKVDLDRAETVRSMFASVGQVDAIVCVAGGARFASLEKLTDDDFDFSLRNKLMGQANVIRHGLAHVRDGGSITVTSGVLAWHPMPGSAAISLVNAGLEAFVGGAALEAPRGIRVNVVSPPWVSETVAAMNWNLPNTRSAAEVAQLYRASVEGKATADVFSFGANGDVTSRPLNSR